MYEQSLPLNVNELKQQYLMDKIFGHFLNRKYVVACVCGCSCAYQLALSCHTQIYIYRP